MNSASKGGSLRISTASNWLSARRPAGTWPAVVSAKAGAATSSNQGWRAWVAPTWGVMSSRRRWRTVAVTGWPLCQARWRGSHTATVCPRRWASRIIT